MELLLFIGVDYISVLSKYCLHRLTKQLLEQFLFLPSLPFE